MQGITLHKLRSGVHAKTQMFLTKTDNIIPKGNSNQYEYVRYAHDDPKDCAPPLKGGTQLPSGPSG